jgi:Uma2 family endonuclease
MPLATKREPFTYHDLENFPNDGKRREIIEGELYVTAAPNTRHQRLVGELYGLIWLHLRSNPAGAVFVAPTEVVFADKESVQPDVFYVAHGGRARIAEKRVMGPPDWVIEVLSSNRDYDLETKRKLYARYGVVYWAVDPEGEEVLTWDEEGLQIYQAGDEARVSVLPEFRLMVSALFAAA